MFCFGKGGFWIFAISVLDLYPCFFILTSILERLKRKLSRIDGRGYRAYKELKGRYILQNGLEFFVDSVQGDPFAPPSKVRLRLSMERASFPEELYRKRVRRVPLQDYVLRQFAREMGKYSRKRGTGGSGIYRVFSGGQEILESSAMLITPKFVEVRFLMGFPGDGRRVSGKVFLEMVDEIRKASKALYYDNQDKRSLYEFVNLYEDQELVRSLLEEKEIVAFVGDGSILPRRSGVDDRPMHGAVPFYSPDSLRVEFETKYHGRISGMGIPRGVTLIVGGGFHGKTTLLEAIQFGVYNHIPGDGREWVITVHGAVKVRSEDGRYVEGVDISPFIGELPMGIDTTFFSTEDASGSTSLAASIMEALEMGATLLLMDEDTSATNFLIRDARMQALISKGKEPITPFIDKVRLLLRDYGVSTIMVLGGSGDYLDVADKVIAMDSYRPVDLTDKARKVASLYPTGRKPEGGGSFGSVRMRMIKRESFLSRSKKKVKSRGIKEIYFGEKVIDVSFVEQIARDTQLRCIAEIMKFMRDGNLGDAFYLRKGVERVLSRIVKEGFDFLTPVPPPDLSLPRAFEVASAVNRMRTLKVFREK